MSRRPSRTKKVLLEEKLRELDEGKFTTLNYHSRRIRAAQRSLELDSDLDDDEIEEVINIVERYLP